MVSSCAIEGGNVPVGLEDHVAHFFPQDRGLLVERLADDDAGAEHRRPRVPRRIPSGQLEHRDVHQQEGLVAQVAEPAQPLERQAELMDPPRQRNIELVEGLFA